VSGAQTENIAAQPLSPEHHQALALANQRLKKVLRAAGVASFNGWVTSIFAVCSGLIMLFDVSVVTVLITIGLTIVAFNEFLGRRRLLRLNPTAPKMLGWNQVFFMSMICLYCCWSLYGVFAGPNKFDVSQTDPELQSLLKEFYGPDQLDLLKDMYVYVFSVVYILVILLTIVFQGGNALYYFRRGKDLAAYLAETPEWIVKVQRSLGA